MIFDGAMESSCTFRCISFPRFVLVVAFRVGLSSQTLRLFTAIGIRVGIFSPVGKSFLRNNF